jgi:anti-sigma-K factor RskA
LNYRNKPALQERLAAEYALGTLRGPARARFRRWMREDAALARAAAEWEARLAPMAQAVAPVRPPRRVWDEIQARLGPAGGPARERGGFWRMFALMATGAAAALVFMTVLLPLQQPAKGGEYVAVLSDPKTQKPVMLVSAGRRDAALRVKMLDPSILPSDASLEIWALPKDGKPRSLGLVPPGPLGTVQLAALADKTLSDVPALAISLEPRGGSPTGAPTGPVLYSGPCLKDW